MLSQLDLASILDSSHTRGPFTLIPGPIPQKNDASNKQPSFRDSQNTHEGWVHLNTHVHIEYLNEQSNEEQNIQTRISSSRTSPSSSGLSARTTPWQGFLDLEPENDESNFVKFLLRNSLINLYKLYAKNYISRKSWLLH